jgi:O-succinylbenzoic acid--CoA ligase
MIKIHKNFKLNSNNYNKQELVSFASNNLACNVSSMPDLSNLILEIFNDESFISCKTSGSTGKPKVIRLEKQSLVNSACMTGTYFNLLPGHSAVSFLPMNFIAGKMMLVRAMVLGLDLSIFTPTSNPSDQIDKKYFSTEHKTEYAQTDKSYSKHHFCAKFFSKPIHRKKT